MGDVICRNIIGHTLLRMVGWCIRLMRLTLIFGVIRYSLAGSSLANVEEALNWLAVNCGPLTIVSN